MFEINPLVHYVRIGEAQGRQFRRKDAFELSAQASRFYTALRQLEPLLPPLSEFPTIPEYSYSKPCPAAAAYLRLAKLVDEPFENLLVVGNTHNSSCEQALAAALMVNAEKVLLLSIDSGQSVEHLSKRFGVRAIGMNDIMVDMASAQAVQVLLRLIVQAQPRVVHNFDSAVCWRVFERFHRAIKSNSHCYASLCDWRRDSDGAECGEFTSSFNMCLEHLDKIFLPGEAELKRLEHLYFLPDSLRSKIVLTNTGGVKTNSLLRNANNVKAGH